MTARPCARGDLAERLELARVAEDVDSEDRLRCAV